MQSLQMHLVSLLILCAAPLYTEWHDTTLPSPPAINFFQFVFAKIPGESVWRHFYVVLWRSAQTLQFAEMSSTRITLYISFFMWFYFP